jgi:hypothetical protein
MEGFVGVECRAATAGALRILPKRFRLWAMFSIISQLRADEFLINAAVPASYVVKSTLPRFTREFDSHRPLHTIEIFPPRISSRLRETL